MKRESRIPVTAPEPNSASVRALAERMQSVISTTSVGKGETISSGKGQAGADIA